MTSTPALLQLLLGQAGEGVGEVLHPLHGQDVLQALLLTRSPVGWSGSVPVPWRWKDGDLLELGPTST